VSFATAVGEKHKSDTDMWYRRLSDKNVKLVRPTLNNYLGTREEVNENAKAVWDFILSGQIKVAIHEIYPLKDVARAHEDLEGRKTTGKLLLKP
jgi:NADPH2:quinone reductase